MSKFSKRLLMLFMLFILSFSAVLTGCGSDNNINNEKSAAVNDTENIIEESAVVDDIIEYGDFKGYLWEIRNEDSTVYLFGSIHLTNGDIFPFQEEVETSFEVSDFLVVEADVTDMTAIQNLADELSYKGSDTVYDHLSEEGILKFEAICEELDFNPIIFQKLKIWALGSNLMSMQLMKAGITGAEGIDMYFLDKAKNSKEILELESIKFQFDMMNDFTDEQQEKIFLSELGTVKETADSFYELFEKFKSEDLDIITEYLLDTGTGDAFEEDVEKKILVDRNIGMANKIDEYLQTDKTYFIVVGLAHYLGDDSVIKLLEEKDYEVNRK